MPMFSRKFNHLVDFAGYTFTPVRLYYTLIFCRGFWDNVSFTIHILSYFLV